MYPDVAHYQLCTCTTELPLAEACHVVPLLYASVDPLYQEGSYRGVDPSVFGPACC